MSLVPSPAKLHHKTGIHQADKLHWLGSINRTLLLGLLQHLILRKSLQVQASYDSGCKNDINAAYQVADVDEMCRIMI